MPRVIHLIVMVMAAAVSVHAQTSATIEGVRPDEKGTLAFQPTVAGPPRQFQFDVFVRF